jgi:hypothetical protein
VGEKNLRTLGVQESEGEIGFDLDSGIRGKINWKKVSLNNKVSKAGKRSVR